MCELQKLYENNIVNIKNNIDILFNNKINTSKFNYDRKSVFKLSEIKGIKFDCSIGDYLQNLYAYNNINSLVEYLNNCNQLIITKDNENNVFLLNDKKDIYYLFFLKSIYELNLINDFEFNCQEHIYE